MEKLIKLLDEYDHKKTEDLERWKQRVDNQKLWIISKQFWFIERLVEKDKLDLGMVREKLWIPCCVWYGSWRIIAVKDVANYKQVLMLLSISDTPIDDLVLYLK